MMIFVQFCVPMFTSLGSKTLLNMMVISRGHGGDRCTFVNHVLVVSNNYQEPVSPSNTSTGLHLIRHAGYDHTQCVIS